MINPDKVDVQIKEMSKEQLIDISKTYTNKVYQYFIIKN